MWNPNISSVKEPDYEEWFEGLCTFREKFLNWSIWDYEHVGYGDRFVLVRVGDEKAGIVMEGFVSSDCYEDDDWAGSDRKRYYADLVPMTAYNPEMGAAYPGASLLQEHISDFDWNGGHSGRILTDRQSKALEELLNRFKASENSKDVTKMRIRDYIIPASGIHPTDEEKNLFPDGNPQPFIESFIMQSIGVPVSEIEQNWEKHQNVWVRGHEALLRSAAWMAFPIRTELPYYGVLCLKLSRQYWGVNKEYINAAYAKEAADFLTDPQLRHSAVMTWLAESLRHHQNWGTGWAVDPMVSDKISGLDTLSEFLGYDVLNRDEMLHDYYLRRIDVNTENDYIDVDVSYDAEGTEEDILTFHITGSIEAEVNFSTESFLYIDGAQIGPWGREYVQLQIDGYGLQVRGSHIDIRLKTLR